ncbi:MAG: iron-sulfur cluster assembly accessory protein [Gammaproteobacteria bacterium]|nr:iron-sulfur cluster assembly accessory protein [Gammaproteobacteria bacterium]
MENVGIYTPPQKVSVVSGDSSATFQPSLTVNELEVTQSAQDKLHEIVSQTDEDVSAIRIYISGGGCGGLSYGMTFTDEKSDFDTTLQFEGFKVLVDVVALNYLKGAQIDYIQEVGRERFVFNNVFAETGGTGVCGGCGAAGG